MSKNHRILSPWKDAFLEALCWTAILSPFVILTASIAAWGSMK